MPHLPHLLIINGQNVGLLQQEKVRVDIPEGTYSIKIQSLVKWFSSTRSIHVSNGVENILTFGDKEKVWDLLFVVDIVLWFAEFFFTLPHPWELVYKIFTNGYLVLWILYEWIIRNKYFSLEFHQEPIRV